jgi:hypothetical protein
MAEQEGRLRIFGFGTEARFEHIAKTVRRGGSVHFHTAAQSPGVRSG